MQSHILNEIARRLPTARPEQIAEIADAVGIDIAGAADPLPSIDEAAPALFLAAPGEVIHGAVPFEMKLTVLGQEVTQTCRAVFSATLTDDVDRQTGKPIRILAHFGINWQVLDWRDRDQMDEETGEHPLAPAPVWTDDFEGLLPTEVPGLLLDLIEAQAVAFEESGKSNS